ncbi:MAG: ABC transporter substrate-binding protein [Promethearchaeota archaeon]
MKKIFAEHKIIVVGGLIGAVAIAGIVGGVVFLLGQSEEKTFIFGCFGGLESIDSLNPYYIDQDLVPSQIVEPLFNEKWTGNYYDNVPYLALKGEWSKDSLNFTCPLRKGIKFHDGTPFNATAVKWNFDRLLRLLPNMTFPHGYSYIWYHADGIPILNKTLVLDDYTVRFVLNRPYVPFRALLTHLSAHILSPASTPANRFLNDNEKLIGTGPYKFESNIRYKNTTIIANHKYWGIPEPRIERFVFLYTDFSSTESMENCSERILYGETHFAMISPPGRILYLENYSRDPNIIFNIREVTSIEYLGMDNNRINVTMRKAISYALNYTSIFEKYSYPKNISVPRLMSPISKGLLYANWTAFDVPFYNVSKARQILIDAKWPGTAGLSANDNITSGNEWEAIASSTNPLETYNISYLFGMPGAGWYTANLTLVVKENLKQIGIHIDRIPRTRDDFIVNSTSDALWWSRYWSPDFNDPSTNINPLFSSKSDGFVNDQHTNDTVVQQWIDKALVETDETVRKELYYKIQERLIEELYPVAWLFSGFEIDVWNSDSRGWENWGNSWAHMSGVLKNL